MSAVHFPSLPHFCFVFFFFYSILTPGLYLFPLLNCSRTVGLLCFFSVFCSFFRWWECLLLGDWARGEPNIFSTFGHARRGRLRTTLDSRLFHITQSLSPPLPLTYTYKFFPFFFLNNILRRSIFSAVEIKRYWGICVQALPSST